MWPTISLYLSLDQFVGGVSRCIVGDDDLHGLVNILVQHTAHGIDYVVRAVMTEQYC